MHLNVVFFIMANIICFILNVAFMFFNYFDRLAKFVAIICTKKCHVLQVIIDACSSPDESTARRYMYFAQLIN